MLVRVKIAFLLFVLSATFATTLVVPRISYAAVDELTLGIFPRRNAKATITYFKPLAEYLSRRLNVDVKLVTAKNFKEFWRGVSQNKYDIVHYNQLHYIESHEKQGYEVILKNEEFGSNTIAGALVVRKDSGIRAVSDLKGKKILFGGGKKAMISYVVNTAMIRRAGLAAGDYIEVFAKNPPNATIGIYHGHAHAAGIGNFGLKIPIVKNKGVDTKQLTLLIESEPLPHLPWAVKGNMSFDLRMDIQQALLELNNSQEGKRILKQAKLSGLHIASDEEYDVHRKILLEVTNNGE